MWKRNVKQGELAVFEVINIGSSRHLKLAWDVDIRLCLNIQQGKQMSNRTGIYKDLKIKWIYFLFWENTL